MEDTSPRTDLDILLSRRWHISSRKLPAGVKLLLEKQLNTSDLLEARKLLVSRGVPAEIDGTTLRIHCAGYGADPETYKNLCMLLDENAHRIRKTMLEEKMVEFNEIMRNTSLKDCLDTPATYPELHRIPAKKFVEVFPVTCKLFEGFHPRCSVVAPGGRKPSYVTMRFALSNKDDEKDIRAALTSLYQEWNVACLASKLDAGAGLSDVIGNAATTPPKRRSAAASHGPYVFKTMNDETLVVCFSTPYVQPTAGKTQSTVVLDKLCEQLGLSLVDTSRGRSGGAQALSLF